MKNLKSLKNLLLFVFLCLLIFIVGGCGGSSNRIVSQNPGNQENINENNEQNSELMLEFLEIFLLKLMIIPKF